MNEAAEVIKELCGALDEGRVAALVTVVHAEGSTPRGAGAKMLVFADGSIRGTVGGGSMEALSIRQAVECLRSGESGKFAFDLKPGGNTGMICMGSAEIYVDVYRPATRRKAAAKKAAR